MKQKISCISIARFSIVNKYFTNSNILSFFSIQTMTSNFTGNLPNHCTLGKSEQLLYTIILELRFYILIILGISYPFAIVSSMLSLVALCCIRKWKSSIRTYYYVIAVANVVALFSGDWQTFLLALTSLATRWFPNTSDIVKMLHWEVFWPPLCALSNFVSESIILPKLWVIILFCVHRTWIVFQPLRAQLVNRVFRPAFVISFPVGLTIFVTPFLWLSFNSGGILLYVQFESTEFKFMQEILDHLTAQFLTSVIPWNFL